MSIQMDRRGLPSVNRPASRWIVPAALVAVRAFRRMFGRDVMLYTNVSDARARGSLRTLAAAIKSTAA